MSEEEIENITEDLGQFDEQIKVPRRLNSSYAGYPVEMGENTVKTRLRIGREMLFDDEGLAYNGFVYMAANYAAQLAINEPYAVTIGSRVSFLAPAKMGDIVDFDAKAYFNESKKREVRVLGKINGVRIFDASFQLVVLEDHIFRTQKKEVDQQTAARQAREAEESGK